DRIVRENNRSLFRTVFASGRPSEALAKSRAGGYLDPDRRDCRSSPPAMRFDPPILTSENSAMLDPSGSPLAEAPPREPPARAGRPRPGRWGKRAIKAAIGLLVLWAVGRHVAKTWRDLSGRGQSLHVEWTWIAAAVALYLAGLCAFGAFFARVM